MSLLCAACELIVGHVLFGGAIVDEGLVMSAPKSQAANHGGLGNFFGICTSVLQEGRQKGRDQILSGTLAHPSFSYEYL